MVWVSQTIVDLLAPDRRTAHTCAKGLAKGMHVSGMVRGKRLAAMLSALIAVLALAEAGGAQEAGSRGQA